MICNDCIHPIAVNVVGMALITGTVCILDYLCIEKAAEIVNSSD